MATKKLASTESCVFDEWTISSVKNHILCSDGPERNSFEDQIGLPSYPEMIFDQNRLILEHSSGCGVEFNAIDALKLVDQNHDIIQVAETAQWKEARSDCEHIKNIINPFDWTFSTDYRGTLFNKPDYKIKVLESQEGIDTERLKVHEKILFYADVLLFEDELHDHGCSMLNVKIRVMPKYFFVLLRQYMRVDGVLVRNKDTRFLHQVGTDYVIREFTNRECPINDLKIPPHIYTDVNEAWNHLPSTTQIIDKLVFPSI